MSNIKDINLFLKKLKKIISKNSFYKNLLIKKKNNKEKILNNNLIEKLNYIINDQYNCDEGNIKLLQIIDELKNTNKIVYEVDNSIDESIVDEIVETTSNEIKEYNFLNKDIVIEEEVKEVNDEKNVNINNNENQDIIHNNELIKINNKIKEIYENIVTLKDFIINSIKPIEENNNELDVLNNENPIVEAPNKEIIVDNKIIDNKIVENNNGLEVSNIKKSIVEVSNNGIIVETKTNENNKNNTIINNQKNINQGIPNYKDVIKDKYNIKVLNNTAINYAINNCNDNSLNCFTLKLNRFNMNDIEKQNIIEIYEPLNTDIKSKINNYLNNIKDYNNVHQHIEYIKNNYITKNITPKIIKDYSINISNHQQIPAGGKEKKSKKSKKNINDI